MPDTNANGRISDVAADFYIHLDHSVAGFSEHDTFRSNQAREGDQSREEALWLVADGNRQRYPNIKWYSVAVGLDFREVIEVLNAIPPLAGRAS